jgi:hypothetical protein
MNAVDRLSREQYARWDDLRGQSSSEWPAGLYAYMQRKRFHNGEDIMEAIAQWVLTAGEGGSS